MLPVHDLLLLHLSLQHQHPSLLRQLHAHIQQEDLPPMHPQHKEYHYDKLNRLQVLPVLLHNLEEVTQLLKLRVVFQIHDKLQL